MKAAKTLTVIVVLGVLGYMTYGISLKYREKETAENRIAVLPNFTLERLQGGFFMQDDLSPGSPLIFLYYNSSCTFCRAETRAIKKNMKELGGNQLIFVSPEDKTDIKGFAEEFGLYGMPDIVFLQDTGLEFAGIFGIKSVPTTYLYNKDRTLIRRFNGPVKIESIIEALQKSD